ncbi:histone-like transcription factor [Rhizophagus clarus]|uniref:Histone-like transcription factor n=2 Tax=Rhizophagus clarus TaxID=94130 RepID=A0A8H3MAK3_9GLOM|nr:histone-like transcription factor [Rhizophagus clarus]
MIWLIIYLITIREAKRDSANMDASKATGASVLPIARVKRIIKLDEEITTIGTDTTFLIAIAAELFVDYFVKKGSDRAKSERRKTIRYEDMANIVKEDENLEFLQDIVPQPQTFEDYLENRNRRKKKRKAKVIDEDGSGEEVDDNEEDSEDENSDEIEENGNNSSDLENSQSNEEISDTDTINENNSDVEDSNENNSEEGAENESEVENGINSQEDNSDAETSMNGDKNHRKRNRKNVDMNNGVSSDSELSDAPETSSDNSTVLNDENE